MTQDASSWTLVTVLALALSGSAVAQTPSGPPPKPAEKPEGLSEVQGSVEAIDRRIESVRVAATGADPRSTILHFANGTEVVVRGAAGSIQDLHEGDRVKAWYEDRSGIRLLRRIEVLSGG